MKLIIDIEDEALERLSTVDPNLLYTAIKNGKPYEERPQGEWIDERNDGGCCLAICSNCRTLEMTGRYCRTCGSNNTKSFLKSFNCGAEMKGGAE